MAVKLWMWSEVALSHCEALLVFGFLTKANISISTFNQTLFSSPPPPPQERDQDAGKRAMTRTDRERQRCTHSASFTYFSLIFFLKHNLLEEMHANRAEIINKLTIAPDRVAPGMDALKYQCPVCGWLWYKNGWWVFGPSFVKLRGKILRFRVQSFSVLLPVFWWLSN